MKPPAIKTGDTIGVMAPSSYVETEQVEKARLFLENKGFQVFIHPQTEEKFNQSAGTNTQKTEAFHDLIKNPDINAIFAAGGGNRALHILDMIDYDLVAAHPKIIMGFSDVTALLNAINAKTGLTTFHGPVVTWIPELADMFDFNMAVLRGETPEYPMEQCRILRKGNAKGHLVGGNLSVFHLMPNTNFAPVTKGGILFLEDLREEINKIDRMLLQLRRTGVMAEITGIICGNFRDLGDNGRPYGFTLDDLLLEHTAGYDIPIVMNAPFGHGKQLYTMPIGGHTELYAGNDKVTLTLTESATA